MIDLHHTYFHASHLRRRRNNAALTYPQLVAAFLRLYVDEDGDAMPIDDIVHRSFAKYASPKASRRDVE